MWVLEKEHTFSNYPIPLAWANDSLVNDNNEEMSLGVFLGAESMATYFHPGGVSYQNGTYYRNVRGLGEAVKLLSSERRYTDFPLRKSL